MDVTYEFYPEKVDRDFYVEFSKWTNRNEEYRIFKKQLFEGREMHPWQLLCGEVADETLVSFTTKGYLKFVVDAMNEKAERDNKE